MIVPAPLTREQIKKSQKNYLCFGSINGFSYMCLGETIIILVAVQIGMPDILISILGAMLYLGYLLLPMGLRFAARDGASACQSTFWILRSIAAIFVVVSVFLARYCPVAAWILLLTVAFLFYGFRAAGVVMTQPLIGGFTSDEDRSKIFGNANFLFYFSGMLALIMVTVLLKIWDPIYALCTIIIIGACMGAFSSKFIRELCETEELREFAKKPIFSQWKVMKKNPLISQVIYAGFCKNAAMILTGPPSVLMLKKGYGLTDMEAVLFSVFQLIASFTFSWVSGKMIIKRGPRLVMILGLLCCLVVSFFWMISPFSRGVEVYVIAIIAFFLYGTASAITDNANVCYFLMVTPKEQQIAGSVMLNLVAGAGAGVTGMGIAAGLIWLSNLLAPSAIGWLGDFIPAGEDKTIPYKLFFVLVIPFYLYFTWQSVRLKTVISSYREEHGEQGVRKTVETGRKGNH